MEEDYKIKACRSCGNENLHEIIDLGNHFVSNFFSSKEDAGVKVPLKLVLCNEEDAGCGLLQLEHDAPNSEMWDEQYWYKSAINPTIRADLKDIVENVEKITELGDEDMVIDIGCNDGTMLGYYQKDEIKKIGFEPSKNVAKEAHQKGFEIINDFFNKESFQKKFGKKKAKAITAISMFYDLEDPNKFLEDIDFCLDDHGLFVIQQNYLIKMLENNGLDNICHEHREYYSFRSLNNLLEKHGFETFDVILNSINGGSIRTYIRKKSSSIISPEGSDERIKALVNKELTLGLNSSKPYLQFSEKAKEIKKKLLDFMQEEKNKGKLICGSGASTKGNTILQYFGIGPEVISHIGDKNPDKFGKMTVGSWIPIEDPEKVDEMKPDYLFVLIWFFLEDIKKNHQDFLERGGKLIVPFPEPRLVSKDGVELI